eukprot:jgi/Chlat1/829/Chrsp104S01172
MSCAALLPGLVPLRLSAPACRPAGAFAAKRALSVPGGRKAAAGGGFRMAAASGAVKVVPATIIGGGRVGEALYSFGEGKDLLVKRGECIPDAGEGPILVCTRNDDLEGVVSDTPVNRREDLVFLQNGMLEPWLQHKGLENNTQVLAYFAVAKKGEKPIDGKTDTNPEGLTAANGKWAEAVAARLSSGGLSCKVLDKAAFEKAMFEKLIWISSFMAIGGSKKDKNVTVGVVESQFRDEVVAVIRELAAAMTAERGWQFESGLESRLCAYSRSVAHFPTAVKEFPWRNGYFYNISKKALDDGKPDPMPKHTEALWNAGAI